MDKLFFNDEHEMLRSMVQDFAKNEVEPVAQELDEKGKFPRDLVNQMGELGLLGIPVPEKYGGSGMDTIAYTVAMIELAKADASLAITMQAHTSLGIMPIVLSGSEEQKLKYVPDLASGKMLGCFGLTETGAGSDAGATQTTAELKGDKYIINGSKIFITNAGEAGLINLTAQVIKNGEKLGVGAFVVPMDTEGLEIMPKEKKMGWRASDTRQLFFNNMHVPAENMLGDPSGGFRTFLKTLIGGRIAIAALAVGTAEGAYERALKYSTEREAFGKPIYKFQPISFKLADMATKIEAAKLLVYHAAWLKDQGVEILKEASMAKLYASDVAMDVTTEAIQVFGGYGYVKEYDVERYFRDAKVLEIGEGTSEIQRIVISREIIKNVLNL
jgi:alkylation response protein AidB-like acyl-CoA dehydrogenase